VNCTIHSGRYSLEDDNLFYGSRLISTNKSEIVRQESGVKHGQIDLAIFNGCWKEIDDVGSGGWNGHKEGSNVIFLGRYRGGRTDESKKYGREGTV
jgi:hypothetical protein